MRQVQEKRISFHGGAGQAARVRIPLPATCPGANSESVALIPEQGENASSHLQGDPKREAPGRHSVTPLLLLFSPSRGQPSNCCHLYSVGEGRCQVAQVTESVWPSAPPVVMGGLRV